MTISYAVPFPSLQDKIQGITKLISANIVRGGEITVIARSSDSPVIHALDAAASELHAAGVTVRAIFLQAPAGGWVESSDRNSFCREVRVALNPRLLEAHEQLVLAAQTVWIGDCMRRDPAKRDAFAQAKIDCAMTTMFATLSFEKLWAIGMPVIGNMTLASSVPAVPAGRDVAR